MAFTAIDVDTSWQDLAIAAEIAASYNLRRTLLGLSTIAVPDDDSLVFDFISAVQTGIEEMAADAWVNNSGALSSFEEQSAYPSKMTLSQAMTAAGLTETGYWRRIAEGGTQPAAWTTYSATGWSYGKIQDKDLAGPWLFKDIQLALAALTRVSLTHTEYRKKYFTNGYYGTSMPSNALSFGSWTTGAVSPSLLVIKRKDSSDTVVYVAAVFTIAEFRFDIAADPAGYESARLMLTKVTMGGDDAYASYAGKVAYDNLTAADVTTVIDETVGNSSTPSTSGGTTSYNGVIAEDADNVIPLYNDIIPDANVPSDDEIYMVINFQSPVLLIDFAFE